MGIFTLPVFFLSYPFHFVVSAVHRTDTISESASGLSRTMQVCVALGSGFHKTARAAQALMAIVMPNSLLSTQGPFKRHSAEF